MPENTLDFNVKVLSQLGLSEEEAVAYSVLVGTGSRTAEEVVLYSGRPAREIKEALAKLAEKGYARLIPGVLDVYVALNPQITITAKAEDQLQTELNKTISEINDMWKYSADQLTETTSNFKTATIELSENKISALKEASKNFSSTISQTVQKLEGNLKELSEKYSSSISEFTTEDFNSLETSLQTLRTTLSDEIQKQISDLESSMAELDQKAAELVDSSSKILRNQTDNVMDRFSTIITEVRDVNSNSIKQFEETLITITENLEGQIEAQRENLSESVKKVGHTIIENFKNNLSTLHSTFSKSIDELISQINAHIDSSLTKTATSLDLNVDDHADKTEEARKLLSNAQDTITTAFQNVIVEIEKGVQYNETLGTALNEFQEKTQSVLENLTSLETNLTKKTNALSENTILTLREGIKEGIDNIQKGLQSTKMNLTQFVESSVTSLKESNETFAEETRVLIVSKQEDFLSTLDNITDSTKEQLRTQTSEAQNNILTKKETVLSALNEQIQETKEKLNEQINRMQNDTKNLLEQFNEQVKKRVNTTKNTFLDQVKANKKQIEEEIDTQISQVKINETEINTKLDNLLKEMTEKVTQLRTSTTEETSKITQESTEQLKTYLSTLSKSFDETLSAFSEKTSQESEAIRKEIPPALDRLVTDHKNRIQTFDLTFSETHMQLIEMVSDIYEKLQDKKTRKKLHEVYLPKLEEMNTNLGDIQEKLRSLIETHVTTFETESSRFIDQIERSLTLQIRNIQDLVEQSKEKIETTRNETGTMVEGGLTEAKNLLLNTLQQTIDQNLQTGESSITQVNTALQNSTTTQTALLQSFLESLTSQETAISTAIKDITTGTNKDLATLYKKIKTNQSGLLDKALKDAQKTLESARDQAQNSTVNISQTAIEIDESLLAQMLELIDSQRVSASDTFENLRTNISEDQEKRNTELETTLEKISTTQKEDIVEIIKTSTNSMKDTVDETITQISDLGIKLTRTSNDEIERTLRDSSKLYRETTDTITQGLSKQITSFNQETMPAIVSTKETFSSDLASSLENVENILLKSQEEIKTSADDFKETMNELPQMTGSIEKDREKMDNEVKFSIENTISALRNEVVSNENRMHEIISKRTEEAKASVTQLQKEELPQALSTNLQENLDRAVETVNTAKEEVHTQIESETENLRSQSEKVTAIPVRNIQTKAMDFQKSLEDELGSHSLTINKHLFEHAEKLRDTLGTHHTQTKEMLDSSEVAISKTTSKYAKGVEKNLLELSTGVTSTVDKIKNEVTKKLSGQLRGIPERIHTALKATGATMTFLKQVHDFALKTKPLAIEQTYPIFGKEAVLNSILGCLSRVKSTINLVVPNLEDIPLDVLETVPSTRRIELITGESSIAQDYITELINKLPNVVVRKTPEIDAYIAFRDAEEVIIGTGEGDSLVSIATTQEEFVRLLGELQSRFRSQSRPV